MDEPLADRNPSVFDFPFAHPMAFSIVLEICAVILIIAAIALHRLHRWGARVIEVAAWLGLVYVVCFAAFAVYLLGGLILATDAARSQPRFLPGFAGLGVINLGIIGTPLVLTVLSLRRSDTRDALR